MTDPTSMIWFLATAVMTITVLAVGTLAAADLLPGRRADSRRLPRARSEPDVRHAHDPRGATDTASHDDVHEQQAA